MSKIDVTARYTLDAYRGLDRSGRAKVRAEIDREIMAAVRDGRTDDATALVAVRDLFSADSKVADKVTVSDEEVIARRIVTLRNAADMLEAGVRVPEGIDASTVSYETVSEHLATVSEEDGWSQDKASLALAGAKITRNGKQHDVPALVTEALTEGDGPMTVSQIAKAITERHESSPSTGAIGAALARAEKAEYGFRQVTVDGKVGAELI